MKVLRDGFQDGQEFYGYHTLVFPLEFVPYYELDDEFEIWMTIARAVKQ